MRAFSTTPTAWPVTRRAADSNWRASSHAFRRMSSCADTDTAVAAAGSTTLAPWETCTWGIAAAEAERKEMTADAPGMRLAENLAAEAGSAADVPSGLGSEAGQARAPTVETAGQSGRSAVLASADY